MGQTFIKLKYEEYAALPKTPTADELMKMVADTGFICLGIGAMTGFISCVLTLTNPVPELYNVILYGLTSVAVTIIFIGLYFVFE